MDNTPCTYRISAKAVIKDDGDRILLLKERNGEWELPGGGLEHGEDVKAALRREISEETGLTVEWVSGQPVAFWTIKKEVGSPTLKWFGFILYEVRVSGDFRPDLSSDEAQEVKYFDKEEVRSLRLHDNVKPYFT